MASADSTGGQNTIEHEVAMDGLRNNTNKAHEEKDRKMARLQQLAFLNTQQSTNQGDIAEANKRKAESAMRITNHAKLIEDLQAAVKELNFKLEACETKNRESEHKQRELDSRLEQQRKAIEATIFDRCDALAGAVKVEGENRARLAQEMQQMVRLREQKLKQALLNELNEEANSRMAVAADVVRLTEVAKDIKSLLDDEIAKVQAKMTSWSAKLKGQISDTNDQLNAERTMRERADIACRSDLDQSIKEMKNNWETKAMETDADQDARLRRLGADISMLQQHLEIARNQSKDSVDDLEKKHLKKIGETDAALSAKIDVAMQQIEEKAQQSGARHVELKSDIKQESSERNRCLNLLQQELAQEHLRREQDESAIINMLDTFMRQVKDMNTVS